MMRSVQNMAIHSVTNITEGLLELVIWPERRAIALPMLAGYLQQMTEDGDLRDDDRCIVRVIHTLLNELGRLGDKHPSV